jgi:hypothetical protein
MKTKVPYRISKILLLVPIPSQMNIIRNTLIICFKIFSIHAQVWKVGVFRSGCLTKALYG